MYEIKDLISYRPYNNINEDYDKNIWKSYNTSLETNNYGLKQIKLNLSDVTLMGTPDSIKFSPEIINRLQLRFNKSKLLNDAFYIGTNDVSNIYFNKLQTNKAQIHNDLVSYYNY